MNRGANGQIQVVRQRLGELGVGLGAAQLLRIAIRARGLVRSGVVRDIRAAARRAYYQLVDEARNPRTASTLAQRIGIGPEPTSAPMSTPNYKRGPGALLPDKVDMGTQFDSRERDNSGYTQIEYSRGVAGQRLNKVQRVMKSLAATIYSKIDRAQVLGTSEAQQGALGLDYQSNNAPGKQAFPVYFMDLTSMDQYKGASVYPYPLTRLKYDNAVDVFYHDPVSLFRNADDTANIGTWTTEVGARQTPTAGNAKATYSSFLDWVDCNFMLFGPRYFPSTVTVSIVQFLDELVTPTAYFDTIPTNAIPNGVVDTGPGAYSAEDRITYNDFYVSLVDRLVRHPLARKGRTKVSQKMKTLYSKTFEFNPTSTTESDSRGHQNMFRLRYNLSKVVTYNDNPAEAGHVPVDTEIGDPDEYPQYDLANDLSTTCARKGRVYLMISGYSPVDLSTTTFVPPAGGLISMACPSFDVQVRRKSNHVNGITHQQ